MMEKETASITIHDVAEVAGVSISTVSRVVNDLGRVAPETRRKVELAIRRLNFRPNSRAQALSRKRTDTIGLIVPDFEGHYFAMLMEGAHQEAQANGVHIMVLKAKKPEEKIEAVTRLCSHGRTDGVILMLSDLNDTALFNNVLEGIGPIKSPLVVLDQDVHSWRLDNILVDNKLGAFEATKHFIYTHNVDDVFFLGGSENNVDTTARALGFSDAIKGTGLKAKQRQFFCRNYSYDEGYRLAGENILPLIEPQKRYGIVAANDDIASGVMDFLMDSDIEVPKQAGVIGFDDSLIASQQRLKITTMRIPTKEIGKMAVRTILNRFTHKENEPAQIVLKAELIIRQSCGCELKKN
jgi:LacI family transcriptional regulator